MANPLRRKKASDIFRETEPVFSKKVSLKEAFPEIEDLRVEVEESGSGIGGRTRVHTYTIADLPGPYIDCSNVLCYNGGFSIESILRDMVSKRQAELESGRSCQGYEGSPKGKKKYRDCLNWFKIKVSLKYKNEEVKEATA